MLMVFNSFVFAPIMNRVNLTLGDYMAQLQHQAANRKISTFKAIGKGNPVVPIDRVPPEVTAPSCDSKAGSAY